MQKSTRTFRFRTESCDVEVASSLKDGVFRTEARDSGRRLAIRECWRVAPTEVREQLKLLMQLEGCDVSGTPVRGDVATRESAEKGLKDLRSSLVEKIRSGSLREADAAMRSAVPFVRIENAYSFVSTHVGNAMDNDDVADVIPVVDELQTSAFKAQESYSGSMPVLGLLHLRSIRSKLSRIASHFGDTARFMQIPVLDDSSREATAASCARINSYAGGLRAGLLGRAIVAENMRGRVATAATSQQVDDVLLPATMAVWRERAEAGLRSLAEPDYVSERILDDEMSRAIPGMDTDGFIATYAGRFFGDEIGGTIEAVIEGRPIAEDEARRAAEALRGLDLKHAEIEARIIGLVAEIESRIADPTHAAPLM